MQNKKTIRFILASIAIMCATTLFAQTTATKNTYSIYSMYGLGDLSTQGTLPTRSMGGAGVASRSGVSMNLLNPASYSIALQKGILIDFGAEGGVVTNSQNGTNGSASSSYYTAKFNDIALQVPITKDFGFGFSVSPYSTMGYYVDDSYYDTNNYYRYNYQGNGDITEVKLGVGLKVAKGLHVGIAAQYYWGLLTRYYSLTLLPITSSLTYSTALGVESHYFSKVKGQLGIQWEAIDETSRKLTVGATYDIGGNLSPEQDLIMMSGSSTDLVAFYAVDEEAYPEINLPMQTTIGVHYRDRKWAAAIDATYQDWSKNTSTSINSDGVVFAYQNVAQIKLGAEYTPSKLDVRNYMKRASYRMGARVGNYYKSVAGEVLPQWAVTAGIGLPMDTFGFSNIDVGLEYGSMGSHKTVGSGSSTINLVKQNYFKLAVGITLFGDDYWFQRPKYE